MLQIKTKEPTEYEIQKDVVIYLEGLKNSKIIDAFTSIPNSTFTKSISQQMKNKYSGLRAGFPDLVVVVKGKTYFIEMKRPLNSTVQPNQKEWIKTLNQKEITAFVACSLKEVELIIKDILEQKETINSKYFNQNLKGVRILKKLMNFE